MVQASIAGVFRIVRFLTAAQKTQISETTKAFYLDLCESGRPQIAHVPTVGSRSIPVNASDSFNFGSCNRPIPWLIIPAPSLKPKRILLPTRRSAGPRHIDERFEVSNFRCDPSPFETAPLLQS